ncbi:ATP-binding protein [Hyalangium minutum]|uniref:histidine kinase n=1 Tax=Hyalangium minutum TaxID=394096 RepID=A0A085W3T2_9BACT|nr:ATP-binding protein [Hyalangium minutum]KFE62345.1 Histidine kinase [Hyalangium minutum]
MEQKDLEERLAASHRLMDELTQVHADLVTQGDYPALFDRLLRLMLRETRSEYGFIAEIVHDAQGAPFLRSYSVTNITWTEELNEYYEKSGGRGIEFRNLKTLFGKVLTSGEPLLTNEPFKHPASGGLPPGHPPLRAFLGVPFHVRGEQVGMVGIANRPGGYDEGLISFLKPLLTTCGIITYAARGEARRRDTEQALRTQQEQLQAFIEAIPDMIFRLRLDGVCLAFKASALDAPLMAVHEFVGKNLLSMPLPPALQDPLAENLRQLREGGSLAIFEYALELPSGLQHYEARLVRSGLDEAMAIVRNVTERKRAEDQRRRQQEELEERVRQVTRELEARQAQLIQAEKLASLGQMAASIAHELNNPVSYVFSNVATLDEYIAVLLQLNGLHEQVEQRLGAAPPEAVVELLEQTRELRERERVALLVMDMKELLGDSREGLSRIREFVHSLKTFVREESGTPQRADLTQVLQMSLRMVRHEFKYKCEVQTEFAPLPEVRCFPTQLNQVFMNLLVNAGHAVEQRGEIYISSRQEGDEAVVRIKDTGKGMGPETVAKLFTPFFTTKPAGQGTGLGLSICDVIIQRHNGRIEVESEPGKGTTFTVRLPLGAEPSAPDA